MTITTPTAETLATAAAHAAIEQGGSDPFDSDGNCLLPAEASDADYEWLTVELQHEPSDEEWSDFCATYARWMRSAIAEACDARDRA